MGGKVLFSACGPNRGGNDFPGRHMKIGDQALRPMPNICILGALDQTWRHRQGGGSALQRLAPRLLIRAHDGCALLRSCLGLLVHLTHRGHLVGKRCGIIWCRVEPVLDPMGLQIGLI
jgi:hypothetical protein